MNGTYSSASGFRQKMTWRSLLASTYSIYQKQFWIFWRMALPVTLLAFLFRQGERSLVHLIFNALLAKHLGPGWIFDSPFYLPVVIAIGYIEGAVYWILSTILFAAVARNVVQENYSKDEAPLSDAYSRVRQRLKVLFIFAIVTWTPFWVARGLAFFCGWKLVGFLGIKLFPLSPIALVIFSLPLLIIGSLFSRMGLAVPELMGGASTSVRAAIRISIRKTENWEPFFLFFLAKSAVVGYAVYWLAQLGLNELWTRTHIGASAYDWLSSAVYIGIAATLESPLFIAFSVLYRESQPKPETALTAPAMG